MSDAYAAVRGLPLLGVLSALGITTQWRTRKDGQEWSGPCPVCQPKKNQGNFSFHADGRWHCFSCHAKGRGAIDLVKAVKQCGFQEAVAFLGSSSSHHSTRPTQSSVASVVPEASENPPFKSTYEKFAVPSAWLRQRGLAEEACKHFDVFEYNNPARRSAYSGSVMLKIRRYSDGECVGYLSRNIGEVTPQKPKYCFPKGFQKSLEMFGAWQIKPQSPLRVIYVVESPLCVVRLHQLGLPGVSPFGWTVSEEQAAILPQLAKGCIFLPDRDKESEATQYAASICRRVWVKMPQLPDGVDDPERLSLEQIRALS